MTIIRISYINDPPSRIIYSNQITKLGRKLL